MKVPEQVAGRLAEVLVTAEDRTDALTIDVIGADPDFEVLRLALKLRRFSRDSALLTKTRLSV